MQHLHITSIFKDIDRLKLDTIISVGGGTYAIVIANVCKDTHVMHMVF